jgi:hypothetical protein
MKNMAGPKKGQCNLELISFPGRLVLDIANICVPECPFAKKKSLTSSALE